MDNKYENISTCITIVSDDLDTLKTNTNHYEFSDNKFFTFF